MKLLNSIKNFFKTPAKTSIKRRFNNWFKFYNSELANNETIFSAVTMKANAIASAPVSINLDYRSLYHHFECAAYMYDTECIGDIEKDFQETAAKCRQITLGNLKDIKFGYKILGVILKAVAPLL